jgi:ATP-dependent protease ClpP protease subunit
VRPSLATFAKSAGRPRLRVVRNSTDTAAGPELWLYEEIGFWGVTAADVAASLTPLAGERVTLRLNSPGGEVFDGIAIFNLLKNHPGGVDVVVDGLAASAASFIAMAGESVTMQPHSRMMIHDALAFAYGNAAELTALAALLDDLSANIASIYAERSGGDVDAFRELMRAETWLDPQAAVDLGLADAAAGDGEQDDAGDATDDGTDGAGDGQDGGDTSSAGDATDGEEPADEDAELLDRWTRSVAYQAAKNTRGRVAAKAPAPVKAGRPVPPAPRVAAVAVDDIRSIMRGAVA